MQDFDIYKILEESEVDYLAIEDSGKIVPLSNNKVSVLVPSDNLKGLAMNEADIILESVSPDVLLKLTSVFKNSDSLDFVKEVIHANRAYLLSRFTHLGFEVYNPDNKSSVEWLEIPSHGLVTVDELVSLSAQFGVGLTKSDSFFGEFGGGESSNFIRIPLARDPDEFKVAIDSIFKIVNNWISLRK